MKHALINKALALIEPHVSQFMDRRVRLAVTGLSRAGKTLFTTSLISQLEHAHTQGLSGIAVEVTGARVGAPASLDCPAFPYRDALLALGAHPPRWPERTEGISEIRVAVRYRPRTRNWLGLGGELKTLFVDIVDYPGEWLLDLPLLQMDFATWSSRTIAQAERPPRCTLAQDWLSHIHRLNPADPLSDAEIRRITDLYKTYLHRCRSDFGLNLIQPGRFIMPGNLAGAPLMEFFPLKSSNLPQETQRDSLLRVLSDRFEAYKDKVVKRFYQDHFTRFDRQIILVDVLAVLNGGAAVHADTQEALSHCLESFRYHQNNWFTKLFSPAIDRVLFAATKADQVTRNQTSNLLGLLSDMLYQHENTVGYEGVESERMAIASLCCTQEIPCKVQGKPFQCIKGNPLQPLDEDVRRSINEQGMFPGQVPSEMPSTDAWPEFDFIDFTPPQLEHLSSRALPNLRMAEAIRFLLGDRLI